MQKYLFLVILILLIAPVSAIYVPIQKQSYDSERYGIDVCIEDVNISDLQPGEAVIIGKYMVNSECFGYYVCIYSQESYHLYRIKADQYYTHNTDPGKIIKYHIGNGLLNSVGGDLIIESFTNKSILIG